MKENCTELVFILDMSGSMASVTEATIAGFNKVIEEQKKTPGEKLVTTVLFNHDLHELYTRRPIAEVEPLTKEEYEARGTTALLDAMGLTLNEISVCQIADEDERPEHTLFFITTDGKENASRHSSEETVRRDISLYQERWDWKFIFLAADLDALETARRVGIRRETRARYCRDIQGEDLKYDAVNRYITNTVFRMCTDDCFLELEADADARS